MLQVLKAVRPFVFHTSAMCSCRVRNLRCLLQKKISLPVEMVNIAAAVVNIAAAVVTPAAAVVTPAAVGGSGDTSGGSGDTRGGSGEHSGGSGGTSGGSGGTSGGSDSDDLVSGATKTHIDQAKEAIDAYITQRLQYEKLARNECVRYNSELLVTFSI